MHASSFSGGGQLTTLETLGGKAVLVPFGAAVLTVLACGWAFAPRDPTSIAGWLPLAAGGAFVIWFGRKAGLFGAIASVVRGAPRPRWRIEIDDLGVRHLGTAGDRKEYEWFEIARYDVIELGIVLWLRLPENGANAILLPRRFFPAEQWGPLVELVRAKLPSAARAKDEAAAAAKEARRSNARRSVVWWFVLVGLAAVVWYHLNQ